MALTKDAKDYLFAPVSDENPFVVHAGQRHVKYDTIEVQANMTGTGLIAQFFWRGVPVVERTMAWPYFSNGDRLRIAGVSGHIEVTID